MTRRILAATVLAFAAFTASAAAQSTPTIRPGDNGMDTSFAKIETDPRPIYEGNATPVEARILIKNGSGARDAFILMFGFNGLSDSVDIRLEELSLDGIPLTIEKDDRAESLRQPKVWIKPEHIALGEEIAMKGTVTAHGNGQFHVGAIVIAFDKEYKKTVTPANEYAEVYAFGLLSATGLDPGPGRPPFEGQGNVPGVGLAGALMAVAAVLAGRHRR